MMPDTDIHLLSIDIGTTHAKVMLYSHKEGILDLEMESYPTYYPHPGYVEQDPDVVFGAVLKATSKLMDRAQVPPSSISALVFDAILQSLLPVDSKGQALSLASTWADTRSIPQNNRLKTYLDAEDVKQRTGCTLHPMYFLSRLAWIKEETPDIFARAARFISLKEYVIERLFAARQVDYSIASGSGIWNMHTHDWDADLLREIGLGPDHFSESIESTAFIRGGLKKEYADLLGLLAGTPGVIGAFDGGVSHLGSVGLSMEKMSLTVGTGAAFRRRMVEPRVIRGSEAWCYYLAEGNWLLGGVMHDAGNTLQWFADNLISSGNPAEDVFSEINQLAAKIPAGAEGLHFLPLLGGERCPHYRPEAKGVISGLTFVHGRGHLTRALMEGLAYQLYNIYRMLTTDTEPEIVVTGGILKSPVWLKIVADLFGKTLWMPRVRESSAWGGVILGLKSLGVIDSLEESMKFIELKEKLDPDPMNIPIYQKIINQYDQLYKTLYPK
jgi:gluconokinase